MCGYNQLVATLPFNLLRTGFNRRSPGKCALLELDEKRMCLFTSLCWQESLFIIWRSVCMGGKTLHLRECSMCLPDARLI